MSATTDGRSETTRREGLTIFEFDDAPTLDTTVMSVAPVADEVADPLMEWAFSPGHDTRVLFEQPGDDGFSLVWAWFGPNFVLPRHSHNADCLYYVLKGEARLGNRVLTAGSGFFVPADAPYAYSAGADGVEVLEFRHATRFDIKFTENLDRWASIIDVVRANSDAWANAPRGPRQ